MIKMDVRYLRFAVSLLFVERIWSLPLACPYNGTRYEEGETVRTEEPCLLCTCQSGALECSLRVCADQPNLLPPGCFFLHKPDQCCPQLFCEEESFNPPGIELRTGFRLENKLNGNDCLSRNKKLRNRKYCTGTQGTNHVCCKCPECSINGSLYAEGSAVASSQVCEYCYCVEGEMKCVKPRCPQFFQGCRAVHEKSACCPTHYDCRDADVDLLNVQIENFVATSVDTNSSNDSFKTVSNIDAKNEEDTFDESENLSEKPKEVTTTEETSTEVTTVQQEKESTTLMEEDSRTSTSFQTMKTENFEKEATVIGFTTETTPTTEVTTDVSSTRKMETEEASNPQDEENFPEETWKQESRNDSSQEEEDYEAYDYGEPRLPPSLPNLVIFPFVAADAVVKDDTGGVLDMRDNLEIKRIDTHPVFYKDYFSPPTKTEGGFIPKDPFYEQTYFREDQMEAPGPELKATAICGDVTCALPEPAFVDKSWTEITSVANAGSGFQPEEENVRPEELPDFLHKDELSTFQKNHQSKKPVTVTYKNVVVDFYPNYLITTTRARPKIQPSGSSLTEIQTVAEGIFHGPELQIQAVTVSNTSRRTQPDLEETISTSPKTTQETSPLTTETPKSSFFDEFLKSLLSDEITSTPTIPSTKHKYSSKIKGHTNALRNEVSKKEKPKEATDSLLDTTLRAQTSTAAETNDRNDEEQPQKQILTEENQTTTEASVGQSGDSRRRESQGQGLVEEVDSGKPDPGALLKLAGCNIYGMMYRVGKLIAELSGPCLECLCTDFGVQCRPLDC